MTVSSDSIRKINPQIREVDVGIKELRTVSIYPLSIFDEGELLELIIDAIGVVAAFSQDDFKNPIVMVKTFKDLIAKHFLKLLKIATGGEHEDLLCDLTAISNNQFLDIVDILFEVNFADAIERVPQMLEKWKPLFEPKKKAILQEPQLS